MLPTNEEYDRMASTEKILWWYRSLHKLILTTLASSAVSKDAKILDAGCGTGGLLLLLKENGFTSLTGFDHSPHAVQHCAKRGLQVECLSLQEAINYYPKQNFKVIVLNDVLCYFLKDQWEQILSDLSKLMMPGGIIVLNLPAYNAFSGTHDISVGIKHRTSKREIREIFHSTGLMITKLMPWPFLLSPLIWYTRSRQRRLLEQGQLIDLKSDIDPPGRFTNTVLEVITNMENLFLPYKPWGSSIYLVGRQSI